MCRRTTRSWWRIPRLDFNASSMRLCPSSVSVSIFSPAWAADVHNATSPIEVKTKILLLATVKKQELPNGNKNLSTWYARRFFVCLVWLIEHEYSRGFRPCTVTIPPVQLGGWDGKQNQGPLPWKRLSTHRGGRLSDSICREQAL